MTPRYDYEQPAPTDVARPRPSATWRVDAEPYTDRSATSPGWDDPVTVQRYHDSRCGETVRIDDHKHKSVVWMSPATALALAAALLAAADWEDTEGGGDHE